MKKLLSILAAVGLTATASTAVVACTSTIKQKDVKFSNDGWENNATATFTVKKYKMPKDIKKTDLTKEFGVFDGDKLLDGTTISVNKDQATYKKGDKFDLTVTFNYVASATKKVTYEFATIKSTNKKDKTIDKLPITASKVDSVYISKKLHRPGFGPVLAELDEAKTKWGEDDNATMAKMVSVDKTTGALTWKSDQVVKDGLSQLTFAVYTDGTHTSTDPATVLAANGQTDFTMTVEHVSFADLFTAKGIADADTVANIKNMIVAVKKGDTYSLGFRGQYQDQTGKNPVDYFGTIAWPTTGEKTVTKLSKSTSTIKIVFVDELN